jgi:hypothetical protein
MIWLAKMKAPAVGLDIWQRIREEADTIPRLRNNTLQGIAHVPARFRG